MYELEVGDLAYSTYPNWKYGKKGHKLIQIERNFNGDIVRVRFAGIESPWTNSPEGRIVKAQRIEIRI